MEIVGTLFQGQKEAVKKQIWELRANIGEVQLLEMIQND